MLPRKPFRSSLHFNSHYCNLTCVHKRAHQATRNPFFPENFPEFFKGSSTTSCKRKKSRTFVFLPIILCGVEKVPIFPDQGWRFTVIVSTNSTASWGGGWRGLEMESGCQSKRVNRQQIWASLLSPNNKSERKQGGGGAG